MKTLVSNHFSKTTLASLAFVIAAMSVPARAEAFWWIAVRHVVSDMVKPDLKPSKKSRDWWKDDDEFYGKDDGYNPYHAHPDGERSPFYRERDDKGW